MGSEMCIRDSYLLAAVAMQDHDHAMESLSDIEELLGQGFFLGI